MANLAMNLGRSASRHPERPAIRLADDTLSYRMLAGRSGRWLPNGPTGKLLKREITLPWLGS